MSRKRVIFELLFAVLIVCPLWHAWKFIRDLAGDIHFQCQIFRQNWNP